MRNLFLFGLIIFTLGSCVNVPDIEPEPQIIEGLKPVYAEGNWKVISATSPKPIEKLGKIYYKDETIYVVEQLKGIHVIDNTEPTNPVQTSFLEVVGVRDVAIKGNIMYVDNANDLVSLDITDIFNPVIVNRFEDLYPSLDQTFPQGYQGPFECVEESEALIIGWEPAMLEDPQCFR